MPRRSSFLFSLFIAVLISTACAPIATPPATAEQDSVATIVAATQTALAEHSLSTIPPTALPTQPEPTATLALPTALPSPTAGEVPTPVQIAYIKDGNVYLWTEGTEAVELTDSQDTADLQIAGDGELIAYVRQDPADMFSQELWVVNTTEPTNPRVLISKEELDALKPPDAGAYVGGIGINDFAWRQDTHELIYNTIILHDGPGFSPNHDLRSVNVDTLEKTTLLENGEGGLIYLSPDGNLVALSKPESISLVNADGSNLRRDVLTFPEVVTYSEYQYHPHPIWAPDSNSLRVAIPPADPLAEPLEATGLWYIPIDGSASVLLGNIYAMVFAWPNNAFAPNLERVAYAMPVGVPTDNLRELHLANPDGSNDVVYASGESLEFSGWSPDSQHFVYEINGEAQQGTYLGMPDSEPLFISLQPSMGRSIHWLDSASFATILMNAGLWELRIMEVSGEDLALIDSGQNISHISAAMH